jgi:LL-H family phage holin
LAFVNGYEQKKEGNKMELQAEILNLVVAILVACAGVVTRYAVGYLKSKGLLAKLENNKELVKIVVKAVEQTYNHLEGQEKLNVAKLELVKLMNEKKIKISEKEIDVMIEAMVKEMKESAQEASK